MKRRSLLTLVYLAAALVSSASAAQFKALLISKTDGWHHDSIAAGVTALQDLAKLHDVDLFGTEDTGRVIKDEWLKDHQVVNLLPTTGNIFNETEQDALTKFVNDGGGLVGIHRASGTEYGWDWYPKAMGHMFHIHPAVQAATIEVLHYDFPGMDRFSQRFLATEKWYKFDASRNDDLTYLLTVDEPTYVPKPIWGPRKVTAWVTSTPCSYSKNT
ncbi:MAG: ThuA domain-containing protein [Candidatus Synoicihabitans palmerolidicus]|nr:ThuA domain-containing protein [Candidatus Synoicihabitans palmerolidicus]